MRLAQLLLASTVVLSVSAPWARAQDTVQTLETTSGSTIQGKILSNDGTEVEIATTNGATMKLKYDLLTPSSQFLLKRPLTAADWQSQLALADWCVSNQLYYEARNVYRAARKANPDDEAAIEARAVVARTTVANELLARGKKLAKLNPQEARRVLSMLVQELPNEEAATEATQILAEETAQRSKNAMVRNASSTAPANPNAAKRPDGQAFSEATQQMFAPVIASYQKMLASTQAGLTKDASAGINEWEKALKEGDRLRSSLDQIREESGNNEEVTEALSIADEKLEEAVVDVRVNLVDAYMLRTSYNQAGAVVKAGLAQYPKNDRLRQAMNQVTSATAENGGGGWGYVGGRGRFR